ncbi:hypothetical protein [Gemmatimonas sp. UBA7669]|uniref:hypothetical protein n=1 Tax=Gemmatimonas sp. UBA7669 TaxID=1946568 RepID=UPI0025C12FCC|nr:hypothetical protein [Gemmatimonas sp. UBA7669]
MNRAMRSFLLALICLVLGTWALCSPRQGPPPDGASAPESVPVSVPAAPTSTGARPSTEAAPAPQGRGFRGAAQLADHFARHGADVGASTPEAYVARAQALRDAIVGGDVLEIVRPVDGVISRFDRRTGAFGAYDPDGTIRTFFKPEDGEAYFRRQARRRPSSSPAGP